MTGLHWAARRGHYELCELLIKYKSHLDALDILGRTPLFLALLKDNLKVFKLLLYNKSCVNIYQY